jgi:glycerol-3-phosphate acyltransferase PlsY
LSILGSVLLVAAAYVAGAIPWGVVLGRIFANTDLREHGSQSTGTTNAYRVLGWQFSAAVFVLDFAKGLIPVLAARWLDMDWWVVGAVAVEAVIAVIAAVTGREPIAVAFACAAVGAIIFIRHQSNIERLRAGNERRLGRRSTAG